MAEHQIVMMTNIFAALIQIGNRITRSMIRKISETDSHGGGILGWILRSDIGIGGTFIHPESGEKVNGNVKSLSQM